MSTKINAVFIVLLLFIIISCSNSKKDKFSNDTIPEEYQIEVRALNVHPEDLPVLLALQNDTLYRTLEDSLVQKKGYSPDEAERAIQLLINERSLPKPYINYFDEGGHQHKEVPYKYFKKYMIIVKDSLQGKQVMIDSSNFSYPKE